MDKVHEAVLNDIRYHARLAMKDPEEYVAQVRSEMDSDSVVHLREMEQEKSSLLERNENLSQQFIRLYDDYSQGLVSQRQYQTLSAHDKAQQSVCEQRLTELDEEQAKLAELAFDVNKFTQEIGKYAGITKLTGTILHLLIDRIEVRESEDLEEKRHIILDIHDKFDG